MISEQYFDELAICLKRLTACERREAINFYREYATEANINSYEELSERFGSPKILASKVYTESASKLIKDKDDRLANSPRIFLMCLLAILSLPFSLPLAIAIFAIIFSLAISVFAIMVSIGGSAIALLLVAIYLLCYLSFTFIKPFILASVIKYIGLGLMALATSVMMFLVLYYLIHFFTKISTIITTKLVRSNA